MKEFDAIEFARNQRKLKMLTHWLLDTSERFMAIYQKTNAINLNTETEHELSDDPMYTRVPRLFSKKDKIDRHSDLINKFFGNLFSCNFFNEISDLSIKYSEVFKRSSYRKRHQSSTWSCFRK